MLSMAFFCFLDVEDVAAVEALISQSYPEGGVGKGGGGRRGGEERNGRRAPQPAPQQ